MRFNITNYVQMQLIVDKELFLQQHQLPREFNFGSYAGYRFHKYIAEVGNISPMAWFLLAIVIVINLIAAEVDGMLMRF